MRRMVFVAAILAVAFAISPGWADHKLGHDEEAPAGIEALEESIKALEERVWDLEWQLSESTLTPDIFVWDPEAFLTPDAQTVYFGSTLTPSIRDQIKDMLARLAALESGEGKVWLLR